METQATGHAITPPNNTAWRCHLFLTELAQRTNDEIGAAFAGLLGVSNYQKTNADHKELVKIGIFEMRQQTKIVLQELHKSETILPVLYAPITAVCEILGHIEVLDHTVANFPQLCYQPAILSFGWAACCMESGDGIWDASQIKALLNEVIELKEKMTSIRLPRETMELFENLLRSLEKATIEAQFVGMKPLQRAVREATSEINEAREDILKEVPKMTKPQIEFLTEVAEKVEKAGKIASGFTAVIGFGKTLMSLLS